MSLSLFPIFQDLYHNINIGVTLESTQYRKRLEQVQKMP